MIGNPYTHSTPPPSGSVVNIIPLPSGSWVQAPAAAPWLITQCPTLDTPQVTQLGKDGWEPFSVHTGPDAVPRIWWRKREWGP
jgi:hypothetical protein